MIKTYTAIISWCCLQEVAYAWHLHNSTQYHVSSSEAGFEQAKESCRKMQAELVMVKTSDVQIFLEQLFSVCGDYSASKTDSSFVI